MRRRTLSVLVLAALAGPALAGEVDYRRDIKPIFTARCSACHRAVRQKAGLRLDASGLVRKGGKHGRVIVPGKSDASLLIEAVLGKERPRMPPESEGRGLDDKEIAVLRVWIDQGARMPDEPIPADPRQH